MIATAVFLGVLDLAVAQGAEGLPQRKSLIYNRMPSTDAPELIKVFASAVSDFSEVMEFAGTNEFDRRRSFIVGSVREPCSMYQAMWADGVEGGTSMLKDEISMRAGGDSLYSGTVAPSNAKTFQLWLSEATHGLMAARFNNSYPDRQVDCWVRYEYFAEDANSCLRKFELQGGTVEWPNAKAALGKLSLSMIKASPPQVGVADDTASRACASYYDPRSSLLVDTQERFLFEAFGYKCCDGGITSTNAPNFTAYANPKYARYDFSDKVEWEKAGIGAESGQVQGNLHNFVANVSVPTEVSLASQERKQSKQSSLIAR